MLAIKTSERRHFGVLVDTYLVHFSSFSMVVFEQASVC